MHFALFSLLADAAAPDTSTGIVAPLSMTAAVVFLSSTLVWMIKEQTKNFTRMLDQNERKIKVMARSLKVQGISLKSQQAMLKVLITQRVALVDALQGVRQQGVILDTFHDYLRAQVAKSGIDSGPLSGKLNPAPAKDK